MSGLQRNIQVQSDTLANLVLEVEKGHYRIPQFQRDYVWEISKVRKLFDSIYREYPIGSFFLWKAGRQHNNLFRQSPGLDLHSPRDDDDVSFILDGQQRITSIYITLKGLSRLGSDYSHICFDLKDEKFTYRLPDNRRYISVSAIWGPNSLIISRQIDEAYLASFDRCYQTLRTYPISIVLVRDKELDAVCSIFQRINQGGKRLDRFDLISAMTFDPDFDLRERVDEDIVRPIASTGFGKIPRTIVTQLLSLKHKGACTDQAQYSLTRQEIHTDWQAAIDSIKLAIDFLRANCHVVRLEYLPYNPFITLMAYYFLSSGRRAVAPEHLGWIVQWFWRSTFGQRYGGGGATRISQDSKLIDELVRGENPEYNPSLAVDVDALINTKMTSSTSAVRCGFLCLLASKRPLHLKSNAELNLLSGNISGFTSPEKHHIFPQAFLRRRGQSGNVHSLPNFCFIPAELNNELSAQAPSRYFEELGRVNPDLESALNSHLIPKPEESGIGEDDFLKFLKSRASYILSAIENLCGVAQRPEPMKRHHAVERAESQLRDFIDAVLSLAHHGEYWKYAVPSDVQAYVERVCSSSRAGEAGQIANMSSREKLNFCDVSHYQKIILVKNNWVHFEPFLLNKTDVDRQLVALREYRNCVMHNRELPILTRMGGEEALTWLASVLPSKAEILGDDPVTSEDDEDTADGDEFGQLGTPAYSRARSTPVEGSDEGSRSRSAPPRPPWDVDTYFSQARDQLSTDEVAVLQALYEWSTVHADRLRWGRGKSQGAFRPVREALRSKPFFSAYSDGNVVIHFSFTASETNPQLGGMHRLREALEASGFLTSEHAKTLKHPTITSRELSGRVDELLNVFEKTLR